MKIIYKSIKSWIPNSDVWHHHAHKKKNKENLTQNEQTPNHLIHQNA